MSTIQVFTRTVYGAINIYPANEAAETLASIAGTKTLSIEVIQRAKKLGLTVEQVADPKALNLARAAGQALDAAYPFGYRSQDVAP